MIPLGVVNSAHANAALNPAKFLQSAIDTTDASTYTFSSQNLGVAGAARTIIAAINARVGVGGVRTINSVTIGGVSATVDVQRAHVDGTTSGIARAVVPSGTTGDVVVTFSDSVYRCGIALWKIPTGTVTPNNTASDVAFPTGSCIVTGQAGGVIIATAINTPTAPTEGAAVTWTNGVERYDQIIEGNIVHSGADSVAVGSVTLTSTFDSSGTFPAMTAVAYAIS